MIRVQEEDIDIGAELAALTADNHRIGGIATFIGAMRDLSDGKTVGAMTLEHYPGMTEKQLHTIEREAQARWDLEASLIIHRYGRFQPGDLIVFVATAAPHRQAALDSCAFLIDWVKTKAPFWKLEETGDGARWVDAQDSDEVATARWRDTAK